MAKSRSTVSAPCSEEADFHTFLRTAPEPDICLRAIAQARADIRAGRPHVAWCGTVSLYRPNIPEEKLCHVRHLPRLNVPAGYADPLAMQGASFAIAYNGELARHLPLAKGA